MKAPSKEQEITDAAKRKSRFPFRNVFPERLLRLGRVPGDKEGHGDKEGPGTKRDRSDKGESERRREWKWGTFS